MRIAPLASLLLLAACATAGPRASSDPLAALKDADVALDRAAQAHDEKAFGALVCPDAAFGGKSFAVGRDEVVRRWSPLIAGEGVSLAWTPETANASADGELGWTVGRYQFRAAQQPPEEGRYLTVWRRTGGRFCAAMDTSLEATVGRVREAPILVQRSAAGDVIAETGWLADQAGTWLEVRRCSSPTDCRVEVTAVVLAPPREP